MNQLRVEDLTVKYGAITALNGISFEIEQGELVSMIGANGAGKSTTLMTISGILRPVRGRVVFDGREIHNLPAHEIVNLGVIQCPEGRQVFTRMTVRDNLLMGGYSCRHQGKADETMRRVFELFPVLEERKNQIGDTLSGGEQQMLAIGRALMARPKLLLLDEPSLGLAPLLVERVFETIKEIRRQGVTVLLVEQNAQGALEMSDRSYVLEVGNIVLRGTGEQLLQDARVREAYMGA